jgi:hypothetical protein
MSAGESLRTPADWFGRCVAGRSCRPVTARCQLLLFFLSRICCTFSVLSAWFSW